MKAYCDRAPRGFTLIELMTTLAVVAVLVTIGIPGFRDFIANTHMVAETNDLVTSLNFARSEAVRRNAIVSVCASVDGSACSGSSDWSAGWIVFNGNGNQPAGTADVLRVNSAASGMSVTATGASYVRFSPLGMTADRRTEDLLPRLLAWLTGTSVARADEGGSVNDGHGRNGESDHNNDGHPDDGHHNDANHNDEDSNGSNGSSGGGSSGGGGAPAAGGGAGAITSFTLCDGRTGEQGRVITVNSVGRVSLAMTQCQ